MKLVDHGHAFPETIAGPNSTFYSMRNGQPIPNHINDAFTLVAAYPVEVDNLRALLTDAAVDALVARASAVAGASVLQI